MNHNCFQGIAQSLLEVYSYYKDCKYFDIHDVVVFSQRWNSTALGFGGIGGDSMTRATTTVVLKTDASADVYFGGRLAYSIHKINQLFMDDLAKRIMKPCRESGQYENKN